MMEKAGNAFRAKTWPWCCDFSRSFSLSLSSPSSLSLKAPNLSLPLSLSLSLLPYFFLLFLPLTMTTIKKLKIQGIRSYSPDKPQVIEFFHPLTIIVGSNGCGKTTIIEALKFVTASSQPPLSDNGKSFVHDPQVG